VRSFAQLLSVILADLRTWLWFMLALRKVIAVDTPPVEFKVETVWSWNATTINVFCNPLYSNWAIGIDGSTV
jgi:hypothetical protein